MHPPRVLVLDDERQVRDCVRHQLKSHGYVTAGASCLDDALKILKSTHFDLVVCDVRMPDGGGIDFLHLANAHHPDVAVVLMSGTDDVKTAVEAMRLGAMDYISKPFAGEQIADVAYGAIARARERSERNRYLSRLEDLLCGQGIEIGGTLSAPGTTTEGTLNALVNALDAREHETEAHSRRVGEYTLHLAGVMEIDSSERETIRKGALLHDIGKIGISDRILLKPTKLSPDEWVEMRRHPEIGSWILRGASDLVAASEIVIAHHERWDGKGYPRGLRGEQIPLGARIFAVVDAFDALTSDRLYRCGESYESARVEIEMNAGTQFDPFVVEQFLRVQAGLWQDIRSRTLEGCSRLPVSPRCVAAV